MIVDLGLSVCMETNAQGVSVRGHWPVLEGL